MSTQNQLGGDQRRSEEISSFPRECYLADGRRVNAIGLVNGQYVVELGQAYGSEDDVYFDGLSLERAVFDRPPTAAMDSRIQQLRAEEDALRLRVGGLRDELRTIEADHKARLAKLQSFGALRYVESFLDGKFTHAVINNYSGPDILTFEQALQPSKNDDDRYSRRDSGLKLLTLFGSSNNDLQWRINDYRDGSGSNTNVMLCMSIEEAKEITQRLINEKCAEAVRDKRPWTADSVRKAAQKFGLSVPQDLADMHAEYLRNALQTNLAKARSDFEKAESALREVTP